MANTASPNTNPPMTSVGGNSNALQPWEVMLGALDSLTGIIQQQQTQQHEQQTRHQATLEQLITIVTPGQTPIPTFT